MPSKSCIEKIMEIYQLCTPNNRWNVRNSKIATEKVQELLNCKLLNSIDTNDGEAIKCSLWSTEQDFKIKDVEKMKLHFVSKYRYIREGETNSKYFLSWKSLDTLAKNIKKCHEQSC